MRKMWLEEDAILVEVPFEDTPYITQYGGVVIETTTNSSILRVSNPDYRLVRNLVQALPWEKIE